MEMDLEKKLEKYFEIRMKPTNIKELVKSLSLSKEQTSQLVDSLYEMEKRGKIYCDEYGNYQHVPQEFLLKHGVIKLSKSNNYYIDLGRGNRIVIAKKYWQNAKKGDYVFVEPFMDDKKKHQKTQNGKIVRVVKKEEQPEDNYFIKRKVLKEKKSNNYYILIDHNKRVMIPKDQTIGLYPGDEVTFQIVEDKKECKIHTVDIVKRTKSEHLFVFQNGSWHPIEIADFDIQVKNNNKVYEENSCVRAKISYTKENGHQIEITEELGILTMTNKIERLAKEWGFTKEISKKAIDELNQIKDSNPEWGNRKDLRDLMTFTIDPKNAKDLDDAISLEKIDNVYRLYVHIADVAHYVKFTSALGTEALEKATSCYPSDFVIPQFPPYLSDELCSLKGGVPKLVKTFQTDMDKDGNIIDFNIYNSIIQSDYKMNYDKVNDILTEDKIDEEYKPFAKKLKEMATFSDILQQRRVKRGFLCFSITEKRFEVDSSGYATAVFDYKSGPAQLMIENFMLLTNEMTTNYAYYLDIPFVFRNHDSPTVEQMKKATEKFKLYSHEAKRLNRMTSPKMLQSFILSICKDKSQVELNYISELFLSSMSKAYYSEKNKGHYGLALDAYATITSPIRKGSDYLNHIILTEVLENGIETPLLKQIRSKIKDISTHLSQKQWDAKMFESEVNFVLLSEYARKYLDKEQEVSISFLTEKEMFIRTDDSIDGKIIVSDYFYYDKIKHTMIDKRVGQNYAIGDRVISTMTSIDNDQRQLIFELNSKVLQKKKK